MAHLTFDEIFDKLRSSDESVEIEAKRAQDVGPSAIDTVSAFSNEPMRGGGYLVCGVALKPDVLFLDYEVLGVPDPDKIQRDLATKCATTLSNVVRPEIWTEQVNGKTVVVAFIREAEPHEKPVYIKSKGLPYGAFRRIASTDQHCTDEDIALFYQLRDRKTFDETILPDTSIEDIDSAAIATYRRIRAEANPNAVELAYSDQDLLHALSAIALDDGKFCVTVAGLLLFGKSIALRRHMPIMRVDYIMAPGREWVSDPDNRYEGVEWRECLMTLIPRVINYVMEDIPKAFSLSESDVHRRDIPRIPQNVIREAVVNALMHRSYRIKQPIQIIRYSNRIEIRNPGYSLKPDDRLGEPGSISRNEKIAAVLHETLFAETKGTGIRTMRQLMAQSKLTAPFFESNRETDMFIATFLPHHLFGDDDLRWLAHFADCTLSDDEAQALIVVREVGAMNNSYYRTLSGLDTLSASRHLQRLRDLKLLDQKGRSTATYYVPGERFLASFSQLLSIPDKSTPSMVEMPGKPLSGMLEMPGKPLSGMLEMPGKPLSGMLEMPGKPLSGMLEMPGSMSKEGDHLPEGFPPLPAHLVQMIIKLGKRSTQDEVRNTIKALCAWRDLRPSEIAVLINRSMGYTQEAYLYAMVRDGELTYVYPDDVQNPKQAYRSTSSIDN